MATGVAEHIEKLCDSLRNAALPVIVERFVCRIVPLQEFATFTSVLSTESKEVKLVSADIGICENCLRELKDIFPVPNAGRATQLSASCRMTVPTRPWISLRCVMTVRKSMVTCRTGAGMERPFPVTVADLSCNVS